MSKIIRLQEVDSTNNYAQNNSCSLPDRTFITAQLQSKGKGRRGRSWISTNKSNLYASYIMKDISFEPAKASWIGGLSALYTIREISKTSGSYWIKWPNDIYCKTKKIAGILCETIPGQNNQIQGVIIGIGININMPAEELKCIDKPATSILTETGNYSDIESSSNILLAHLNKLYDTVSAEGINPIFESWKKENALIGNNVEILLDNGNILNTKVLDIERSGELVVIDKDANIHKIYSGDVSVKSFQLEIITNK